MRTAALWIPYIACQVMTNGALTPVNYKDPTPRAVPLWGQRTHRAYLNAIECFAPFAALVITAHIAGRANGMTALLMRLWDKFFRCIYRKCSPSASM